MDLPSGTLERVEAALPIPHAQLPAIRQSVLSPTGFSRREPVGAALLEGISVPMPDLRAESRITGYNNIEPYRGVDQEQSRRGRRMARDRAQRFVSAFT